MKAETVLAPRRFDHFVLDEADARLTRSGKPVPLAPKPFAVLCALARTPDRLLTKNELLDLVWGHRFVTNASLKSAISDLRAALEDDPKQPRYIATVSRRGYRFIAASADSPPLAAAVQEPAETHRRAPPGLAALTALCHADAALADIIRKVAATLDREQHVLDESLC
jgi:DNA-binding winged helix-turn-helix (wHTH) protein